MTVFYAKETKHETLEDALQAAYCDIENDTAEVIEITDEKGDLIYDSTTIGKMFVQSDHEPLPPPPTIRARMIRKPAAKKPDLLDWIVARLHGKPRHWS
jgi:molybdenum cofactor biosynthesis enzyme